MNKLTSLRSYLLEKVDFLKNNPEKLLVFAESGKCANQARAENILNHEIEYTAIVIITDFSGDITHITVPILVWLKRNQPGRSEDNAFEYEAEILNNHSFDLQIKIPLTEFIKVTPIDGDRVIVDYVYEPVVNDSFITDEAALDDFIGHKI
jgi:hypothetical protein